MTPFQQFRLWARRAPNGERAAGAIAVGMALAVITWLLVPTGNQRNTVVSNSGGPTVHEVSGISVSTGATAHGPLAQVRASSPAAGPGRFSATGGVGTPGPTVESAKGSVAAGEAGSAGTNSGSGCASPPGSDQGVSVGRLNVAIVLINTAGAGTNATFGLPSAPQQQAGWQAVIDTVNASGGVACRKLVPTYFQANPLDQSNLEQMCLAVAQTRPFFVFDTGAYQVFTPLLNCFPQHGLPVAETTPLPASQIEHFYPYIFAGWQYEQEFRDWVFGMAQRGWFKPATGFRKLGILYQDCSSNILGQFRGWLAQAAVQPSQVVAYDVGCPTGGFASPSDLEQAILQFKAAGVSNLTELEDQADFPNFTTIAQQQNFEPKYGITDNFIITETYNPYHPDYSNIANAVAVVNDAWGEEHTPGMVPTPATAECDRIMTSHGLPTTWKSPDAMAGSQCDWIWIFRAAMQHAPAVQRTALAAGLQAAGSIDMAFYYGPNDFSAPRTTWMNQYWRVDQFFSSCQCWRVIDRNWHPTFPGG